MIEQISLVQIEAIVTINIAFRTARLVHRMKAIVPTGRERW